MGMQYRSNGSAQPSLATDTTGLTWSDCAQFGATFHAIAVDFPYCYGRNLLERAIRGLRMMSSAPTPSERG